MKLRAIVAFVVLSGLFTLVTPVGELAERAVFGIATTATLFFPAYLQAAYETLRR